MKKKYMVIILLTVLISIIFTGCGNTTSENGSNDDSTLQSPDTQEENLDIPEDEVSSDSLEYSLNIWAHLIEREENADLYQNVEQLLQARGEILFQIISGGEFSIQNGVVQAPHIMVTREGVNGQMEVAYVLVTLEGVDSLEDLWRYVQTVYSEQYVTDEIASRYEYLYVEQDGHLYKAIVDQPGFGSLLDEMKIWQYCSRLFVLFPLESDDPEGNDYRLLSLRENEEKPYGYEIVEEIDFEIK